VVDGDGDSKRRTVVKQEKLTLPDFQLIDNYINDLFTAVNYFLQQTVAGQGIT
jgi:hypothetical protein